MTPHDLRSDFLSPAPAQAVEAAVSIVALHELPADAAEQVVACAQDIGALWA